MKKLLFILIILFAIVPINASPIKNRKIIVGIDCIHGVRDGFLKESTLNTRYILTSISESFNFTQDFLEFFDILVVKLERGVSSKDSNTLYNWVKNGGRLLICSSSSNRECVNKIVEKFGIYLRNDTVFSDNYKGEPIKALIKPVDEAGIFSNINRIGYFYGCSIGIKNNMSVIKIYGDVSTFSNIYGRNIVIGILMKVGKGRLCLVGSHSIIDDIYDNRLFVVKILDWLSKDLGERVIGNTVVIKLMDWRGFKLPFYKINIDGEEAISNNEGIIKITFTSSYLKLNIPPDYDQLFGEIKGYVYKGIQIILGAPFKNKNITIKIYPELLVETYFLGLKVENISDINIYVNGDVYNYYTIDDHLYRDGLNITIISFGLPFEFYNKEIYVNITICGKIFVQRFRVLPGQMNVLFMYHDIGYRLIKVYLANNVSGEIRNIRLHFRNSVISISSRNNSAIFYIPNFNEVKMIDAYVDDLNTFLLDYYGEISGKYVNEKCSIKLEERGYIIINLSEWRAIYLINAETHSETRLVGLWSNKYKIFVSSINPGLYFVKIRRGWREYYTVSNFSRGYRVKRGGFLYLEPLYEYSLNLYLQAKSLYSDLNNLVSKAFVEGYESPFTSTILRSISKHLNIMKNALSRRRYEVVKTEYEYIIKKDSELRHNLDLFIYLSILSITILFFIMFIFSFTTSKLLFEARSTLTYFITSSTIFILSLFLLYKIHPGFKDLFSVGKVDFYYKLMFFSSLYIVFFYLFFIEIPNNIAKVPTPEKPHFWGLISMTFHLVISGLRRRKMNTILTLITIGIIVLSFVAFMSVTSEEIKGLTYARATQVKCPTLYVTGKLSESDVKVITSILNIRESNILRRYVTIGYHEYPYKISSNLGIEADIGGFIATNFDLERNITFLDESIILAGGFPVNDNEVMISERYSRKLDVRVGDYITLMDEWHRPITKLKIVAIFDENSFQKILDANGDALKPLYWEYVPESGRRVLKPVNGYAVLIGTYGIGRYVPLSLRGLLIPYSDENKAFEDGALLADYGKYSIIFSIQNTATFIYVSSGLSMRGVSAIIPVIIGITIGINTMLASVYSKRREISIYSALGFNPSVVKFLFMAEALILSVTGGGIGYLGGLLLLVIGRRTGIFGELGFSITPTWTVLSFILAIVVMIIASIYPSEKAALQVVPSYTRKWRLTSGSFSYKFKEKFPFRIEKELIEKFKEFMYNRLKSTFPALSLYVRSTVGLEVRDGVHYIWIDAEMVSEGRNKGLFYIELRPSEDGRFYEVYVGAKPIIRGMKYREMAYMIIEEIRRGILAWQAIYKGRVSK